MIKNVNISIDNDNMIDVVCFLEREGYSQYEFSPFIETKYISIDKKFRYTNYSDEKYLAHFTGHSDSVCFEDFQVIH